MAGCGDGGIPSRPRRRARHERAAGSAARARGRGARRRAGVHRRARPQRQDDDARLPRLPSRDRRSPRWARTWRRISTDGSATWPCRRTWTAASKRCSPTSTSGSYSPMRPGTRREFAQGPATYERLFALFLVHFAEREGKPRWGAQTGLNRGLRGRAVRGPPQRARDPHGPRSPRPLRGIARTLARRQGPRRRGGGPMAVLHGSCRAEPASVPGPLPGGPLRGTSSASRSAPSGRSAPSSARSSTRRCSRWRARRSIGSSSAKEPTRAQRAPSSCPSGSSGATGGASLRPSSRSCSCTRVGRCAGSATSSSRCDWVRSGRLRFVVYEWPRQAARMSAWRGVETVQRRFPRLVGRKPARRMIVAREEGPT